MIVSLMMVLPFAASVASVDSSSCTIETVDLGKLHAMLVSFSYVITII